MADCVQCGYCCTVRPCAYGEWDNASQKCRFLTEGNRCEKYDLIVKAEEYSDYPMFGCGCSSTLLNDVREAKIRKDRQ